MQASSAHPPTSLARYGSAPGSLLASIAESILSSDDFSSSSPALGFDPQMSRFFSPDSSSESTSLPDPLSYPIPPIPSSSSAAPTAAANPRPQLIRHSSSPAGFFSHLMVDNGYSISMGIGNYSQAGGDGVHAMANRSLQSQLSFSRQDSLSQITEISIADIGESIVSGKHSDDVAQAYMPGNYQIGSWDETNSIVFSAPPSKRVKDNNGDIIPGLSNIDSQFSLPKTSLLQSQQDYVPFRVRAKRGCATHPRSIAERERRTRISEKLRKLQDLVPNMDKQTNTTDMLELAVQHIKSLQSQVQKLNEELAMCKCGTKTEMP